MTDFMFSAKAIYFIKAWKRYDEAALRHSASADLALKNGRQYYMPRDALKRETDDLCDTRKAFAEELGISSLYLMRALEELRRDGVDRAKAVRLVMQYLEDLVYASS